MSETKIPTFDSMMNPLIQALKSLGGSGTIEEINYKVAEIANITDEQLEILHDPEKGSQTEIEYRLAWTRTYLKKYGILENSSRGVWALTTKGLQIDRVNPKTVKQYVREQSRTAQDVHLNDDENIEKNDDTTWQDELLETILQMSPDAFERLTQRILRESGFIQVEVTGRSGDGGIDGKGIMRLGGLLSFHVIFQCKRYQGSVGSDKVRDFRGAMVGRADKGLLISTGNFTREAIREATRDGASAIDLIDGDKLLDLLKNLELGLKTETVEQVTIDHEWFMSI